MVNVGTRDARRREAFLSGLATGQSVNAAAASCGMSRASVYRWRERSARFARQWDEAVEGGADLLEREAWRRAVEGTVRPVFAKGQQVGEVRHYSDRLLMFLLQAKRPQVYRPRPAPSVRQPDIPEDLDRRVKAARERVRAAASLPLPPKQDAPKRPPDPPARKDDDDPPTTSASFLARHGRYPTGYEVMKLGIKCFQAVDRQVTDDHVAAHRNEYRPRAQRGEGAPKDRMGKGHTRDAAVCSPSPSAPHPELVEGRPPSPQAGKVMMSDGKSGAAREADETAKSGLGRTLARLCRAGIDAVLGQSRAGESIDGLSQLSHVAHRMPILRVFWRRDADTNECRNETKQPPMAAFPRKTCLIASLRLPVSHPRPPSAVPA